MYRAAADVLDHAAHTAHITLILFFSLFSFVESGVCVCAKNENRSNDRRRINSLSLNAKSE